jgi:type I restriction enzyme S subunit
MSEKSKKLVPRKRFPEFLDAGEWSEKELTKFSACELSNGVFNDPKKVGSGYKLINVLDMYIDTVIDEEKLNLVELSKNEFLKNKVETGDIFFTRSSLVKSGIAYSNIYIGNSCDITFDGHLIRFRPNKNILLPMFANYLLRTSKVRTQLVARGKTATMTTIGQADVGGIKLTVPDINEQQKIANCLSSLDQLITAQIKKIAVLKDHKKGLMQQLFPAEGEPAPKLRFPEFQDAGEWEEKLIEDFFLVGSSKRVLQESWTSQGIPFYRTRELVSLSKKEPFSSEIFISEELFAELSKSYGLPSEGDFLVSGVGTLGISYQVKTGDRFYFKDGNVLWLKIKKGLVSTYFKYCFQSDQIQNQILGQTSKSTVGTFTIQNCKKTKFWYPPCPQEQQKIANWLSSIDEVINAETKKLEAYKAHKKGLVQKLFPNPIEAY